MRALLSVALSIIGLATLSVLFSPKATTSQVIGSSGQAFATVLAAAERPVTG